MDQIYYHKLLGFRDMCSAYPCSDRNKSSDKKFKVGDIVRGTSPTRYIYTNKDMTRARVIGVEPSLRVRILEHIQADLVGEEYGNLDPKYFELVEEEKEMTSVGSQSPKLKIGDLVRITEPGHSYLGEIGVIKKPANVFDWLVNYSGAHEEPFYEKYLQLVEEETNMTKNKKFFFGQPLITKHGIHVLFLYDDKDECQNINVLEDGEREFYNPEDLTPSNEFDFHQVVAGLEANYFKEDTKFEVDDKVFYVGRSSSGLGLKETERSGLVRVEIGAHHINSKWKLIEDKPKELSMDELETLLGYKVKIKNNE